MISKELVYSLKNSLKVASDRGHEYVTVEHILHAFTFDQTATRILEACGADVKVLREDLQEFFERHLPSHNEKGKEAVQSVDFMIALQIATHHSQSSGQESVDCGNVLVSMFQLEDSFAVHYLKKQNVTRFDVVNYVSHGVTKGDSVVGEDTDTNVPKQKQTKALESFCVNLAEKAKNGHIDPVIGRQAELDRTIFICARRRKNNPLFVGDAGVGKTALAEGLALKIHEKQVPRSLQNAVIFALDMASLLAGTKFRGEFENRLKAVLKELKMRPNALLFIDEIHTIIGAGATSGGSMDASNLLKPALAGGNLRCIGSTTYKEYKVLFEKDHALSRRFQKIEVLEPTIAESIQILNGLASRYAVFHNVIYSKEAIKAAVNLSAVHIHDRQLPDKAIDVLDESGAKANILNKDGDKTPKVRVADIESIVAGMAKIPPKSVSQYDRAKLENLEAALNQNIFGQEAAISQCCESIILARSPLGDKARPIGSFLFCGSTGVGKTELAKQLAELMGIALIRFDMSEYMEKHTVSRLIGAPPGYIGFDQGGLLTDAIHKTPHAVLLLDEIEKAHEDITNILLQVMDYGALTDANGRKTDFNNAIIILTTNAGSREMNTATIGYRGDDQVKQLSTKVVEKIFNPEFRNRLSAIVLFNPITQPIVEKIVKKEIKVLEKRLAENQLSIQLEDDAIKYLCDKGFDSANGARMIKQIIESEISRPLAKKILFKKPPRGSKILINCKDGRLNHIVIDHIEFPLGDKSKGEAKEELDEANTQNV